MSATIVEPIAEVVVSAAASDVPFEVRLLVSEERLTVGMKLYAGSDNDADAGGCEPIMERAYTVKEIDALRRAVEMRWLYGTTNLRGKVISRGHNENEKSKGVEEMLRTHMLAGHLASDIYQADGAEQWKQFR